MGAVRWLGGAGRRVPRLLLGATSNVDRVVLVRIVLTGVAVTLLTLLADYAGWLGDLEQTFYDRRAADCQFFARPPSNRIVHLDIDDKAVDAIGEYPWPRWQWARILDEISLARPKVVGIDVIFVGNKRPDDVELPDGRQVQLDGDALLAEALGRLPGATIPVSLYIARPRSSSDLESVMQAELTADLELTPEQLQARLQARGLMAGQPAARFEDLFLEVRQQAAYERLRREMSGEQTPLEQLLPRVLPNTDTTLKSPILRVLQEQYRKVLTVRQAASLAIQPPPGSPRPISTAPKLIPLPRFMSQVKGTGFADFEFFPDATVRSMPAFLEHDNVFYAQWALAVACAMADADLHSVQIESDRVIVPSAAGVDSVIIPARSQHSPLLGRDVPMIMDIPWFGGDQWEYMYDYPANEESTGHYTLKTVWDICLTQDKIARNNSLADDAILGVLQRVNPDKAKAYLDAQPSPEDAAARDAPIDQALEEAGAFLDIYRETGEAQLSAAEKADRDVLAAATQALPTIRRQNADLLTQLESSRRVLGQRLSGKLVLIGWTATGSTDMVSTSLHSRCPGVVVHGVIANAVLTGDWWHRAPSWIGPLLTAGLGLLTALAVGWLSAGRAAVAAMIIGLGYLVINGIVLFDYGDLIVPAAAPAVAVYATWAAGTVVRLVDEAIKRIRAARDLAVMHHEMELARGVQQALIPPKSPEFAGAESEGWTLPADMTGGDCFDLWLLPDGRLAILLADASGHGLAPSMIVSQTRSLVRALSEIETHPNDVLARVNSRMAQDLEPGRFITAFLGFLTSDGTLHWASAGHGPMLWSNVGSAEYKEIDSTAMPLGVTGDWFGDIAEPLQLDVTGELIVFSDGIFEAPKPDASRELFGMERLVAVLKGQVGQPPSQIIDAIRTAVRIWQGKVVPHDDQTTIVVRRLPLPPPADRPAGTAPGLG
jgi:serine phosphatase RsbU (regulator of sigma subunit)